MSTPQEKRSPPFQMRLNEDFRLQLENEMRKDGDNALASWIKRILRKELQLRDVYKRQIFNLFLFKTNPLGNASCMNFIKDVSHS